MIRFLADENLNNHIIRGVQLRKAEIDILRIQDIGLSGADDSLVIDYALREKRILLTHVVETIPKFAYNKIKAGKEIPAIFIIRQDVSISHIIENLLLIHECCDETELRGKIYIYQFEFTLITLI